MQDFSTRKYENFQINQVAVDDKVLIRGLSNIIIPILLVFSCYILFFGEDGPGGGFQAGILLSTVLIIYSLVYGSLLAKKILPVKYACFVANLGILIYFLVGFLGVVFNKKFLEYNIASDRYNILLSQVFVFIVEFGVFLSIFGSISVIFYSFTGFLRRMKKINI